MISPEVARKAARRRESLLQALAQQSAEGRNDSSIGPTGTGEPMNWRAVEEEPSLLSMEIITEMV